MLADKRRPREFTEEQYFKSQDEMCGLFADIPEALENAVEIARRCSLTVQLGKNFLPQFPTPDGMSLDDFLVQEAKQGLEKRLAQLYPNPGERERQRPRYEERLKFETDTIIQMGFPGYFLIVADFIRWGKRNGVPVGPGRGSGAGSLVAYALEITDLDPLEYALLFERFLNPERVSMPDFDIDFCQDNRYRVIEYVRERYGKDAVSQIGWGVVEDDDLHRPTELALEVGLVVEQASLERHCRRPRQQHAEIDVTRRRGRATRDAAEHVGCDDARRRAGEKTPQSIDRRRDCHAPQYTAREPPRSRARRTRRRRTRRWRSARARTTLT